MAEPAVPRVTWEDWYAWSMDQFGGDAQLAHPAARSGREALDVGATQEAATRAALSAAEAGRDKPNTAELQPQAKSAWVKKPSPSEPDADAVSSGPPNKEDSRMPRWSSRPKHRSRRARPRTLPLVQRPDYPLVRSRHRRVLVGPLTPRRSRSYLPTAPRFSSIAPGTVFPAPRVYGTQPAPPLGPFAVALGA
jgi:hypothetical protein